MGGGYIQLSAIGEQNAYLTGNPQITFFKSIYRRHTNFSIDLCEQIINGDANFGEKFNVIISNYGDLLSNIYVDNLLRLSLKDKKKMDKSSIDIVDESEFPYLSWVNGIGYAILNEYSVNIGQNVIDTQYGEWLDIYNKLSEDVDNNNPALSYRQISTNDNKIQILNDELLNKGNLQSLTGAMTSSIPTNHNNLITRTITELKFWFCKYYGQAIPLISLNNIDVTINFSYRNLSELINTNIKDLTSIININNENKTSVETKIWGEYIFLDSDERRKFNTNVHEYLIEQVQSIQNVLLPSTKNCNCKINLKNISNCVKAIFWVPHMRQYTNTSNINKNFQHIKYAENRKTIDESVKYGNNWFNYSTYYNKELDTNTQNIYLFKCGQLLLNNEQRTPLLPAMYFANTQPERYFKTIPFSNYIYTYSFSLYPFEHQPSGTCNFSRFDTITLSLENINCNNTASEFCEYSHESNYINIYALSYNILLIHSGTSQLKYIS